MNIVMISPGYPAEMAYFTRALATVGANVIGVGDQPQSALPDVLVPNSSQPLVESVSVE